MDVAFVGFGDRVRVDTSSAIAAGRCSHSVVVYVALDCRIGNMGGGFLGSEKTDGAGHVCRTPNRARLGC